VESRSPGVQNVLPDRLSRLFPPSGLEGESGSKKPAAHCAKPTPPRQLDSTIVKKAMTVDPDRPCSEPPPDQRADIIMQHHLRGHFGIKATIDAIREAGFDWPNMTAQAKEVCAKCLPCQRHNIAKRGYHPRRRLPRPSRSTMSRLTFPDRSLRLHAGTTTSS
jgi:hypothetical protein